MLISATLSKPAENVQSVLGHPYTKIKLTAKSGAEGLSYFAELFTDKKVFHRHYTQAQAEAFIRENAGITFKSCVERTETQQITTLASKRGKITRLVKNSTIRLTAQKASSQDKKKNYIIQEGMSVPFLALLGVMTDDGKIISSKYAKFRQINRFLEFLDDILDSVTAQIKPSQERPLRIADFGCGKSYLTFAVHYFLTEIKHIPVHIEGLDLKKDVIEFCSQTAKRLGLKNLEFRLGNISDYSSPTPPDIVITLHACDTATDFALKYAVSQGSSAILSVPCCQHQVNRQLKSTDFPAEFEPLLKWGLLREKFSSLVTDALRGKWLEQNGYSVQMLEFIDTEHTPKNTLIRAVRQSASADSRRCVQGSACAPASSVAERPAVAGSAALPIATARASDQREAALPPLAKALGILPEIYKE